MDGCIGKDVNTFNPGSGTKFNWGEACFCFYTGQCVDLFLQRYGCWNVSIDISWCQAKWCGQAPFSITEQTVSFFNKGQDWRSPNPDVLTIPKIWFLNINHLKDQCTDDKGLAEVTYLINQGRRDFANSGSTSGVPQWQCLHVQRWVGVEWLHLHTFNGVVHGEELPDVAFPYTPPHALCRSGDSDAKESAQWMLDNIPKNPNFLQAHEQQGGSEFSRRTWVPDELRLTAALEEQEVV
jgi:hypothetical protein